MGALIRSFDWKANPIGEPQAWPQSLRTVVRLMLTTNHPMFVFWGPDLICLYNDAYRASIGSEKHPAMLGAPGRGMWDEIWDVIGPQIDLVMSGRGATWHEDQLVPIIRHGRMDEAFWTYSYSPIDDRAGDGGVGGVLVVCTETTRKVLDERRLREAHAALDHANAQLAAESGRLKRLFEQAPSFMAVLRGPDHVFELTNASYLQLAGRGDLIGKPIRKAVPEVEGQGFFELLDQVYATGEAFVGRGVPIVLQRDGGAQEERFLDFVYQPIFDPDGTVSGIFVDGHDVTEPKQLAETARLGEKALRESEAYLRLVLDSAADGFYGVDRDGVTTICNAAFLRMLGFERAEDAIGKKLHGVIHHSRPDGSPYPIEECPIYRAARTGKGAHVENELFFRLDGSSFPVEYWTYPILREGGGEGAVTTFIDITERTRAQEQQNLLLKEMDHRVKNLFSIVGSIVALSARTAASPRELADTIQGRLGALASAHQLVRPRSASDVIARETTLEVLVRAVLSPYIDHAKSENPRVVIEGPATTLGGDAVTSFALIFHELATNAAKYGALSTPAGSVQVSWGRAEDRLALSWEERGGPKINGAPQRTGFGSLLALRSIKGHLDGQLDYDWKPSGLVVHILAAAERLTPQSH